jgi:hypothetical protein
MRLAVIVPTYTLNTELATMATENAKVWKTQCDDLIISEDGGGFYKGLYEVADLYMLHRNIGVAASMNLAWRVALVRGADYVAIADSDVTWSEGLLTDLCIPGKIGIPVNRQHPHIRIIAPMLVVPKEVAFERGIYNDYNGKEKRMDGFDFEYYAAVKDLVTQVDSCIIDHVGSATRGKLTLI